MSKMKAKCDMDNFHGLVFKKGDIAEVEPWFEDSEGIVWCEGYNVDDKKIITRITNFETV